MKKKQPARQNLGCLSSLLRLIGIKSDYQKPTEISVEYLPADPDPLPYRLRDDFLSPAEKSFYQVIEHMMGNYFTICPKVSLADLFFVARLHENKSAYNRINRKHVGFVICEPQSMTRLFAIELDDSSHNHPDRVVRDEFVDSVFEAAEMPLLHIPVRASYNTNELGVLFKNALQKKNALSNAADQEGSSGQPDAPGANQPNSPHMGTPSQPLAQFCPKCGIPMVMRTAKNGDQPGRKFYGCSNYPRCRVIIPIEKKG